MKRAFIYILDSVGTDTIYEAEGILFPQVIKSVLEDTME